MCSRLLVSTLVLQAAASGVTVRFDLFPSDTLTVEGFGTMTYKAKTKTYVLTASAPTKPETVTVTSSRGGSATAVVN